MTPTEPNAGRAELLVRLDKWASIYPTWGDTEAERRCRDAAAQIRADAAEIQTLAARVAALEALEEYGKVEAECAALRQQRDEAVRDRNYWRSTAAGERAEAATERQRAERAEAQLEALRNAEGISGEGHCPRCKFVFSSMNDECQNCGVCEDCCGCSTEPEDTDDAD